MAAEIAKQQVNNGGRAQVYYFRDQQGLATARDQAGTTQLPGVTALSLTQLLEQLQ